MAETARLLEAAAALSGVLTAAGIPHAFHGTILVALLAQTPQCTVRVRTSAHRLHRLTLLTGNLLYR